jgi:hypothetical protein
MRFCLSILSPITKKLSNDFISDFNLKTFDSLKKKTLFYLFKREMKKTNEDAGYGNSDIFQVLYLLFFTHVWIFNKIIYHLRMVEVKSLRFEKRKKETRTRLSRI